MTRVSALLLLAVLTGCPDAERTPGDENMGQYAFRAEPVDLTCGLPDLPSNAFEFTGTFSRFRDGGGTFLTLNELSRDAGFDGQVAWSEHSAPRTFALPDAGSCAPCQMRVVETITVAMLSKSQSSAVGDRCPANPLDGGVPGPDAGVSLPGSTATGFDSVRVCGDLSEHITGTGTCDALCECTLKYRLTGDRK